MAFETRTVGDRQAWRYVDNLWRLKLGVVRELLEAEQVELLRPIILLHHDAYFEYSDRDRRYLAGHSRRMASELAEVYAGRVTSPDAALFSGWVLTSLGAYVWSPTSVGDSAVLFYRAYQIDSGNEIALQGLSTAYEKKGDYEKAIEYLSRMVLVDPSHVEARLRLVLCQMRSSPEPTTGQIERLTALAGEESPGWIRSVAFQEIARAQLRLEQPESAERTLRKGLEALPGDQHLSLQMAALLERQGRRSEAADVVEAIAPSSEPHDSSRERYDFWEPDGVEEARTQHLGYRDDSLVALSAGLSVLPKEGK